MVSVSSIGQVFNTPTNFYAQPNTANKPVDKEKVKSFAKGQINMGCASLGAGLLAVAGAAFKGKVLRCVAAIPAACACIMLGSNLVHSGIAINKAIDTQA